jgi:hypothetical protein
MQIRDGPNRSPADMFGFDMLVHGLRGDHPFSDSAEENMTDEELEIYGIDWEALQNGHLLESVRQNKQSDTDTTSWIRQMGPPNNLNEVPLFPPDAPVVDNFSIFNSSMTVWMETPGQNTTISSVWVYGLALARTLYGRSF